MLNIYILIIYNIYMMKIDPPFFNVRTIRKRGTLEKAKRHYPTKGITLFLDPSPAIKVQHVNRRALSQINSGLHANPLKSSYYRLNKMMMPQLNKQVIQRIDEDSRALKLAEIALLSKLVQNIGQTDERRTVVAREADDDEALFARLEAQRDIRNLREENEELQVNLRQIRGAGAELRGRRDEAEADLRSDESSQASSERQQLMDRRQADRVVQGGQGMVGISELVALRARERTARLGEGFQEVLTEQPQVRFGPGPQPSVETVRSFFEPSALVLAPRPQLSLSAPPPPPPPTPPSLFGPVSEPPPPPPPPPLFKKRRPPPLASPEPEVEAGGGGEPPTHEPEAEAGGGMVIQRRKEDLSEEQEANIQQQIKKKVRKPGTAYQQQLIKTKKQHTALLTSMEKDKKYKRDTKGMMIPWEDELEGRHEVIQELDRQLKALPKVHANKKERSKITTSLRGLRAGVILLEQKIKQLSDFTKTYKEKKKKQILSLGVYKDKMLTLARQIKDEQPER
jgi:hypothetical protein